MVKHTSTSTCTLSYMYTFLFADRERHVVLVKQSQSESLGNMQSERGDCMCIRWEFMKRSLSGWQQG